MPLAVAQAVLGEEEALGKRRRTQRGEAMMWPKWEIESRSRDKEGAPLDTLERRSLQKVALHPLTVAV